MPNDHFFSDFIFDATQQAQAHEYRQRNDRLRAELTLKFAAAIWRCHNPDPQETYEADCDARDKMFYQRSAAAAVGVLELALREPPMHVQHQDGTWEVQWPESLTHI